MAHFSNMQQIKTNLPDIDKYLKRFKLITPVTLFEPTRQEITKALLEKRCPLCSCKLYQSRDKKIWRCKSMRRDKFIVRDETLKKYW